MSLLISLLVLLLGIILPIAVIAPIEWVAQLHIPFWFLATIAVVLLAWLLGD